MQNNRRVRWRNVLAGGAISATSTRMDSVYSFRSRGPPTTCPLAGSVGGFAQSSPNVTANT